MDFTEEPELERFVNSLVDDGRFASPEEVVREALRQMQEREQVRQIYIADARAKIEEGLRALEAGEFVEGTADELYNAAIARSRQRLRLRLKASGE